MLPTGNSPQPMHLAEVVLLLALTDDTWRDETDIHLALIAAGEDLTVGRDSHARVYDMRVKSALNQLRRRGFVVRRAHAFDDTWQRTPSGAALLAEARDLVA